MNVRDMYTMKICRLAEVKTGMASEASSREIGPEAIGSGEETL